MGTNIERIRDLQIGRGSVLNINWELVSHCQFNCTYCYYKPFQSKTDYLSLKNIVLKKLTEITEPFKINLVGGEPTLHPDFFNLIENLSSIDNLISIALVTNLEKELDFYQKLTAQKNKLKIVASYHPEYPQKDFFEKAAELQNCFIMDIVFIVHNNTKFLVKMRADAQKMFQCLSNNAVINFIRVHDKGIGKENYRSYDKELELFFEEQLQHLKKRSTTETVDVLTENGWESPAKLEFMRDRRNEWFGWNCNLHAFIIHEDGMVSRSCTKEKKHILLTKFDRRPVVCKYKICECDDYWTFEKTPRENNE